MSEERFDKEEPKDEDVEAHLRRTSANEEPAADETDEDSDDVEAHARRTT